MTKPRKHHYVPQFYLGGFTSNGTRGGKLHVLDLGSGKQWQAAPKNAACERDFYMLEFEGDEAVGFEKLLGEIEGRAAPVISQIITSGTIPNGKEYEYLIDFLGVMALRVPAVLNMIDNFIEQILKMANRQMVAKKERWEAIIEKRRSKGHEDADISWEKMRSFVESDDYTITPNQNYRMGMILHGMQIVLPLLAKRRWTFARTVDDAPKFICSDRPLMLCWNDPSNKGDMSPGFGLPGTNVSFPLNPHCALIGVLENNCTIPQFDDEYVGTSNMWLGLQAERFIYSTEQDFTVTMADGRLGNKEQLLELRKKIT